VAIGEGIILLIMFNSQFPIAPKVFGHKNFRRDPNSQDFGVLQVPHLGKVFFVRHSLAAITPKENFDEELFPLQSDFIFAFAADNISFVINGTAFASGWAILLLLEQRGRC
jgi:hypothetical protein